MENALFIIVRRSESVDLSAFRFVQQNYPKLKSASKLPEYLVNSC